MCIEESLKIEVGNRIDFANDILKSDKINEGESMVHYSLIKYKQKGLYESLEDISENVTLVQLMDSIGNVNHAFSVVGCWIFDSDYEIALVLNRESLDMICAPSVGEEQAAKFEKKLIMLSDTFLMKQNLRKDSSFMSPKTQLELFVLLYERLNLIMI